MMPRSMTGKTMCICNNNLESTLIWHGEREETRVWHNSETFSMFTLNLTFFYRSLFLPCACLIFAAAAKSLQLCPTLCNPIDGSPSGSTIPGILQVRTLEWVAISSSNVKSESEVTQSCLTPRDPVDCSLTGSSVHGIFQARVLEWGAIVKL